MPLLSFLGTRSLGLGPEIEESLCLHDAQAGLGSVGSARCRDGMAVRAAGACPRLSAKAGDGARSPVCLRPGSLLHSVLQTQVLRGMAFLRARDLRRNGIQALSLWPDRWACGPILYNQDSSLKLGGRILYFPLDTVS